VSKAEIADSGAAADPRLKTVVVCRPSGWLEHLRMRRVRTVARQVLLMALIAVSSAAFAVEGGALWFRWLVFTSLLLLARGLYVRQLRQLQRQFSLRLVERLSERTRIARELHDSLLQSVQGLMFRLQAVRDSLPEQPETAASLLDAALLRGDETLTEGRNAIRGLRTASTDSMDLAATLTSLWFDLSQPTADGLTPAFSLVEEGLRRGLHPLVREETCRIAAEALRNGLLHAGAMRYECELRYGRETFSVRVRDDGKGFDPRHNKAAVRSEHWGLVGMEERTRQIGGRLRVWSRAGAGTEIELTIPAALAYER
jgi:signal transduction histidine kinase